MPLLTEPFYQLQKFFFKPGSYSFIIKATLELSLSYVDLEFVVILLFPRKLTEETWCGSELQDIQDYTVRPFLQKKKERKRNKSK